MVHILVAINMADSSFCIFIIRVFIKRGMHVHKITLVISKLCQVLNEVML